MKAVASLRYIEKDNVTPEERARMFDEYGQEAVQQEKYEEGIQQGETLKAMETAHKMLAEGFDKAMIAKISGLSVEEVVALAEM